MKRIVFNIIFFLGLVLTGLSQDVRSGDGGTLEAIKMAYLTRKLNLSTNEAQKFWPLYNKYVDEIRQVNRKNRTTDVIDIEERVINIRKKYKTEFTQALPQERVNQFFKVDKEFNSIIRKELQERELKQIRQQNKRPFSQ